MMTSRDLRQIADHLEQLCIESHQRRAKFVACEGCRAKAQKLREHAIALDQARVKKNLSKFVQTLKRKYEQYKAAPIN